MTVTARLAHLLFSWWFSVSDGRQEAVSFDKITFRVQKLCYGLNSEFVDPVSTVYSCILWISVLVFVSLFLCFVRLRSPWRWSRACTVESPQWSWTLWQQKLQPLSPPNILIMPSWLPGSLCLIYTKRPRKSLVVRQALYSCAKYSDGSRKSHESVIVWYKTTFLCYRCDGRPLQLCEPIE